MFTINGMVATKEEVEDFLSDPTRGK